MKAKKTTSRARVTPGTKTISTAAFIRECIAKGKMTDEQILAAARKRPEGKKQNISNYYVNWYRWQMQNRPAKKDGGAKLTVAKRKSAKKALLKKAA